MIDELTAALGVELVDRLGDGRNTQAKEYFAHVQELGQQTSGIETTAQKQLRQDIASALQARLATAAANFDHKQATAVVALAGAFELPAETIKDLRARAESIPKRGQALPNDPAGAVLASDDTAISRKPVTRGEYARFATVTGRPAARCRERASLLRVLAPRDYRDPGFGQSDNEPVVCVSMADAQAYAQWYSRQAGHAYRLPSSAESNQIAPEISGRNLSLWLRDCGSDCNQRKVIGNSWRSEGRTSRTLDAGRGYDDVGFRLVREL